MSKTNLNKPGDFSPGLPASKGCSLPLSTSDELERPRRDLLAGCGHSDDARLAPASVSDLEGAPKTNRPKTFKTIINLLIHLQVEESL